VNVIKKILWWNEWLFCKCIIHMTHNKAFEETNSELYSESFKVVASFKVVSTFPRPLRNFAAINGTFTIFGLRPWITNMPACPWIAILRYQREEGLTGWRGVELLRLHHRSLQDVDSLLCYHIRQATAVPPCCSVFSVWCGTQSYQTRANLEHKCWQLALLDFVNIFEWFEWFWSFWGDYDSNG
jgi:hypothetical protein